MSLTLTPKRPSAETLGAHWRRAPERFSLADHVLDLRSPQGAWELLVYTVLSAAPVRTSVAEHCFGQLKAWGLLEFGDVLEGQRPHRSAFADVLREGYRAPVRLELKRDAIYRNAQRLHVDYGGDLHQLYRTLPEDARRIEALQRFEQVRVRALWFARVMHLYGGWSLSPEATAYYGAAVRTAIARLDFDGKGEPSPWSRSQAECRALVDAQFDGRTEVLYLQGARLCLQNDVRVCAAHCPVKSDCLIWRRWSGTSGARSLDSE